MVRVLLCDDSAEVLEKYRRELLAVAERNRVAIQLTTYISGEDMMAKLAVNPNSVDIIYLDILIGRENGIDLAQKLREGGCRAKIIYLTACEEFVMQSFDTEPFHYIVKGSISDRKFEDIFLRACAAVGGGREDYITVSSGGALYKVPLRSILYFKVNNRILTVHCENNEISYYGKLDQVEQDLAEKGFLRPHRSYLVNCYHIQRIEQGRVLLADGSETPISEKHLGECRRRFSRYLLEL